MVLTRGAQHAVLDVPHAPTINIAALAKRATTCGLTCMVGRPIAGHALTSARLAMRRLATLVLLAPTCLALDAPPVLPTATAALAQTIAPIALQIPSCQRAGARLVQLFTLAVPGVLVGSVRPVPRVSTFRAVNVLPVRQDALLARARPIVWHALKTMC